MDLITNLKGFSKKVDAETGAILYHMKSFKGIPDKVVHGDGLTVELSHDKVVTVDIYNPKKVLSRLVSQTLHSTSTRNKKASVVKVH